MPLNNKPTALVTFATPEFYLGVKVLLKSFTKHNSLFSKNIDFVLLTNDTEFFKDKIEGKFKNIVIKNIELENYKRIFEKFNSGRLQFAFCKFDIFLLEEYDQIVFIDSDVLIQGSIAELFYKKEEFSAVSDFALSTIADRGPLRNNVTFNSGVMVVPHKYLNKETYNNILNSTLYFDYVENADNDILSSYFIEYDKLPSIFNICTVTCPMQGSLCDTAKILHFAGKKPWHTESEDPLSFKWKQYCSKEEIFKIGLENRYDLPQFLNILDLKGIGAEIGVQYGLFSDHILNQWQGDLLYSIDPWTVYDGDILDYSNVNEIVQEVRYRKCKNLLQKHKARSKILRLTSQEASLSIEDNSLDFVYIDARHDYDSIKEDIRLWEPKVKQGGIIAGHDYIDGRRIIKGHITQFGVKKAVDEFFGIENIQVTKEKDYNTWLYLKT